MVILIYYIILIILFIHHNFIKLVNIQLFYFKIKQFKWCDMNVQIIMHVDTCFLELEYFNLW
jgi:hypothetical protein